MTPLLRSANCLQATRRAECRLMLKRICLIVIVFLAAGCERSIRFATCTAPLSRDKTKQLLLDLNGTGDPQIKSVADAIQHANPDVLLLADIDYDRDDRARYLFEKNYLGIPQGGAPAIKFPYHFNGPVNSGVASGYDLDGDGKAVTNPGTPQYASDAIGYGLFPGQHGMVLLSKFPIDTHNIRTFSRFKWKDMPESMLPKDANGKPTQSEDALNVLRLATTSFWDVPINVEGKTVHLLISHPNARDPNRNHDEIRFWADYIGGQGMYIVDDAIERGTVSAESKKVPSSFVILGEQSSDSIDQLLKNPRVSAGKESRAEVLASKDATVTGSGADASLIYLDLKFKKP